VRLRFLGWTVDRWVAISGQIRSELIKAGIPTDRIALIPDRVDMSLFKPPTLKKRSRCCEPG